MEVYLGIIALFLAIVGITIGVLVLLSNVLHVPYPIGALLISTANGTVFAICMILLTWGLCGLETGVFYLSSYYPYIEISKHLGIPVILYGLIIGLFIYFSARVWKKNSTFSPVRLAVSAGLVLLNFILMLLGLAFLSFVIAMLTAETTVCKH